MSWWRSNRDRELDEEIRAHIRMAVQDRVRNGEDVEKAGAEVIKEFGSVALTMEDTRTIWGGQWLEHLAFDLRYACRTLAGNPGFALAAVLSLAIGIGATTALFSVLQHVALQPLPYRDPGKLAIVWNLDPRLANPQTPASYPDWQDWRRQAKGFTALAVFRNRPGFINAAEESPQVEFHEVSAEFLPLLGVAPALGRFWTDEEAPNGSAAVISHHLWQQAFGGSRDIVGRRIVVSQIPYEIIGGMPAGFHTPSMGTRASIRLSPVDSMWVPFVPKPVHVANRGNRGLRILARLDGPTTLASAQRNLGAVAAQLADAFPDSNRNITVQVLPLMESLTGSVRPALVALIGAAALFLLIACANVASLLLARGSARRREFATRAALGAGRARLVRQLMTENLLLACTRRRGGHCVCRCQPFRRPPGLNHARHPTARGSRTRSACAVTRPGAIHRDRHALRYRPRLTPVSCRGPRWHRRSARRPHSPTAHRWCHGDYADARFQCLDAVA
jgi:hypothetical protein